MFFLFCSIYGGGSPDIQSSNSKPRQAAQAAGGRPSLSRFTTTAKSLLFNDPVRWLIDQQSFDGTWKLTETDIENLLPDAVAGTLQSSITKDSTTLTTAFAIAYLESKHPNQKNLWNAVAQKARKLLSSSGLRDYQIKLLINDIKIKFGMFTSS